MAYVHVQWIPCRHSCHTLMTPAIGWSVGPGVLSPETACFASLREEFNMLQIGAIWRYDGFHKWYPKIIHFKRIFHYKPSIWGNQHFGKLQYVSNPQLVGFDQRAHSVLQGLQTVTILENRRYIQLYWKTWKWQEICAIALHRIAIKWLIQATWPLIPCPH